MKALLTITAIFEGTTGLALMLQLRTTKKQSALPQHFLQSRANPTHKPKLSKKSCSLPLELKRQLVVNDKECTKLPARKYTYRDSDAEVVKYSCPKCIRCV